MSWADHSALMDEVVDDEVGDDVLYQIPPAAAVSLKAFILFEEPILGHDAIDDILSRKRLKIRRSLVGKPISSHRIQCVAKLGAGTFRPVGKGADEQGRYWICDLEKVAA